MTSYARAASHECSGLAAILIARDPTTYSGTPNMDRVSYPTGTTHHGWRIAAIGHGGSIAWETIRFCPWCGDELKP